MKRFAGTFEGWRLAMAGRKSPWGGGGGDDGGESGQSGPADGGGDKPVPPPPPPASGPRNPWLPGSGGEERRRAPGIDDIFRNRGPGGPGGGFPHFASQPGRRLGKYLVAGVALLWLGVSCYHQLGTSEQGVVTTLGSYSRTIGPGANWTLPWPIQAVKVEDVGSIKRNSIPEGESENLMLTSDLNLVDFSYLVRWNIKDLKLYTFQLKDPKATVIEVAEAAMRASVAEVPLNGVMGGAGRAEIEIRVRTRMQAVLDAYRSGISVLGVDIKKADPPDKVNDAFQKVTAAQNDAQRDLNNAQAQAQQVLAKAQAEAGAFDKVYEQYKLAPEVTRRRMYYDTMERVLSNNDKVVVEGNGVTPYLPLPQITPKPRVTEAPAP
ncbi:protease modulator HflK [Parablastomonas sp. CN1-191]|uniref:protease modulator HflK n=1 Tax=Parablastomonas sp. CN1-191 TaxID=3400908 RepID=UPI003BF85409